MQLNKFVREFLHDVRTEFGSENMFKETLLWRIKVLPYDVSNPDDNPFIKRDTFLDSAFPNIRNVHSRPRNDLVAV